MSEGVFRAVLRMEIRPGTGPEFERTWAGIARSISAESANLGQWLLRESGGADVYYVLTDWTDEAGFRKFELSEPHVRNRELLGRYRQAGSMETMTLVHRAAP
ncbi:antibiotic biosynthesis monooxygenase family protein [Nocardiopsis potens]|uniref:antibiotic biosynthesis monooxygenase family protein n=1 Tax=Nocardiopsis potens TaxID=1246458 RepID=UPI00034C4455|nr:antibiotic biosynthesis monooxygenase family protein [Nocardiopsis potens]